MKLSEAFGLHGMRAKVPTDVGSLVADAIAMNRPVVIEVPVGRMPRPVFFAQRRAPSKYKR
jgi:thiamine pyrophosphate-dependent acetolactate synthase large subunit-like protein